AKVSSIARIPYVSSAKAEALLLNAKKSVASATDEVTQQLIVATVKQIMHLKKTIKTQTEIMAKACSVSEVDLLKTFIGISDYSAIGLMLNIHRQILFMVAMTAITKNPLISQIYQEHVRKGMKKMAAIGLCMHKILRVIYGMLKHNRSFDPEIDRRNREKSVQKRKSRKENKTRRYQDYDSNAPNQK
ncbi:MAG: IS110 family transposase, partial [Deltaproteobacteria bacterium]|nr:IS110 family transposase [Deltaproteobacteria bacterium]